MLLENQPLLAKVAKILEARQVEAYLVGGAVRDLLLGRPMIVDLDFAVPGDGLITARRVADGLKAAYYSLDPARGTGRVVYGTTGAAGDRKVHLDFATFRGPTLLADLEDRDFTINAMALNVTNLSQLIDPLQGRRDLDTGQIKAISKATFKHDPVRVLRAVRQAVEFDFLIEPRTEQYLRQAVSSLNNVSPERKRDELMRLLNTPDPGRAVQVLSQLGILPHILPEVGALVGLRQSKPHHMDVFDHTAAVLAAWTNMVQANFPDVSPAFRANVAQYLNESLAGDLTLHDLMPMALLLHDTGKPLTRTEVSSGDKNNVYTKIRFVRHEKESAKITRSIMRRLRFSTQATSFVETVVAHHMRPLMLVQGGSASRRAIFRFFRDTGGSGYQAGVAVALHSMADHQATYPPGQGQRQKAALTALTNKLIQAYFEQHDRIVDPPPLLTGRDLIEHFNLPEGRLIGLLLARLKEAQATGQIKDKTKALDFITTDPDFVNYQQMKEM